MRNKETTARAGEGRGTRTNRGLVWPSEGGETFLIVKSLRNICLAKKNVEELKGKILRNNFSISRRPPVNYDLIMTDIELTIGNLRVAYDHLAHLEQNRGPQFGRPSVAESGGNCTPACQPDLHRWDFNVLEESHPESILAWVTHSILKDQLLYKKLRVSEDTFLGFISAIEGKYHKSNSYHNNFHGAQVVHALSLMLHADFFKGFFTDVELFSAIVAASIHDVDHPGLSNQYLIDTDSLIALRYNDVSVLENHHLSTAFHLIKDYDIFHSFAREDRVAARKIIIDMVLGTDMKRHAEHLSFMDSLLKNGSPPNKCNSGDRLNILKYALHCADISNTVMPFDLYWSWTQKLMAENFIQGDRQKACGNPVSKFCDRNDFDLISWQINFIDNVACTLWSRWSRLISPEDHTFEAIAKQNLDRVIALFQTNDDT